MNAVLALKEYALQKHLIGEMDQHWAVNVLLDALESNVIPDVEVPEDAELHEILKALCDDAYHRRVLTEKATIYRDLFDTELMGRITPWPTQVVTVFETLRAENVVKATDWFYQFCQDTNYIRRDRMAMDIQWKIMTEYGEMDISINRSKPEKDPLAIAAAQFLPNSDYPRCRLCIENVGYAGRINHPARNNLRVIPVTINGGKWYFQYSPYAYFKEHSICFKQEHVPMTINRECFADILDLASQFPHYFVGSNADLPIVGGSILAHAHFHCGRHTFALEKAVLETEFSIPGFENVLAGIVKWPMSVIRLSCLDSSTLVELADLILSVWRKYTDEDAMIIAETNKTPHNTITPIAWKREGKYELNLVLRNNLLTPEYPFGIYHSHDDKHHIKKENIGLIEIMGMALLPARLKKELAAVVKALLYKENLRDNPLIEKHAEWAENIRSNNYITAENVWDIVLEETGKVFVAALEDSGVFKCDASGRASFLKFISCIKPGVTVKGNNCLSLDH